MIDSRIKVPTFGDDEDAAESSNEALIERLAAHLRQDPELVNELAIVLADETLDLELFVDDLLNALA